MKNIIIYILGTTVLVGGAFLFLQNKKKQDANKLAELDKLGGTTPSGTTPSGTTSNLSTTSDGVAPSDANLNLANATVLVGKRAGLVSTASKSCLQSFNPVTINPAMGGMFSGSSSNNNTYHLCIASKQGAKEQLVELDKKLAGLGYKVDAIGQLVKI